MKNKRNKTKLIKLAVFTVGTSDNTGHMWAVVSDHTTNGARSSKPQTWATGTVSAATADLAATGRDTAESVISTWQRSARRLNLSVSVAFSAKKHRPDFKRVAAKWQSIADSQTVASVEVRQTSSHQVRELPLCARGLLSAAHRSASTARWAEPESTGSARRVACDASYDPDTGRAAWAYAYIADDGQEVVAAGLAPKWVSSAAAAEFFALGVAAKHLADDISGTRLRLVSDCMEAVRECGNIIESSDSEERQCSRQDATDLTTKRIAKASECLEVFWVKGHSVDALNCSADVAARQQVRQHRMIAAAA